ncbi:MAG: hypothetical protein HN849_29475 [Victivallales bacterium]|nr:hypothetical protein [Victivallales bacterium]
MPKKNKSATEGEKPVIDYRDTPQGDAVAQPFPAKVSDEYRVHISRAAYRRMKAHAATSDEVELCGVLVGEVCRDDQGLYLSVTGAIEGEGANTYGTQVTFTQQTWDHIHSVRERDHPTARIVGWFHTHPGFGVFLSGMDTFIQENFFNAPYQIAVVLETKTKQEGCFGWVDGKITALQRYWVGDREVRLATGGAEPFENGGNGQSETPENVSVETVGHFRPEDPQPPLPGFKSLIVLAVLCVAFGVFWGYSLTRKAMLQALQTEFYSLMEFAGINSAAAQDLGEVREKVAAVRQATEKAGEDEQAKTLLAVEQVLASYEKDYVARDRGTFRKSLAKLAKRRQHLGERVEAANVAAHELKMYIVDIYMLRVQEVLYRAKAAKLEELPRPDAAMVRQLVGRILEIEPRYKEALRKAMPELMRSLYPSQNTKGKTPEAPPKKDPETAQKKGPEAPKKED